MSSEVTERRSVKTHRFVFILVLLASMLISCENAATSAPSALVASPEATTTNVAKDLNNLTPATNSADPWEGHFRTGYVVFKDGMYHMFYTGRQLGSDDQSGIRYAASSDGLTFTKHEGGPILGGDQSGFDPDRAFERELVVDDETWLLFYSAQPGWPATAPAMRGEPDWIKAIPSVFVTDEGYAMYYTSGQGGGANGSGAGGGACGTTSSIPLSC